MYNVESMLYHHEQMPLHFDTLNVQVPLSAVMTRTNIGVTCVTPSKLLDITLQM